MMTEVGDKRNLDGRPRPMGGCVLERLGGPEGQPRSGGVSSQYPVDLEPRRLS